MSREKHQWRDYELTTAGFGDWYYDCVPEDRNEAILDIGCGDGKFFLCRKGCASIEGLEISPSQAEEARKHLKCPAHVVSDICDFLQRQSATYSMITINDVLERIPKDNIASVLKEVHSVFKPGGTMVVNVPQASGFTSLYHRYNDFTHKTLFTEMSLKQVLLSAGFTIKFIRQRWPFKWTPRHIAYRLARSLWFIIIKLIYLLESPAWEQLGNFQTRMVAAAVRSIPQNEESL